MKTRGMLITVAALALLLPAPSLAQAARKCDGTGQWWESVMAGSGTSCALAIAVAKKGGRMGAERFADGVRVPVKSPVTGRTYRFYLWQADSRRWIVQAWGDRGSTLRVIVSI